MPYLYSEITSTYSLWDYSLLFHLWTEAVSWRCSVKNVFLEILQNSQKNRCARVSFLIKLKTSACNFIKKETVAQVFTCEFCKISKNTFSYRTPPVAPSLWIIFFIILNTTRNSRRYDNHDHSLQNSRQVSMLFKADHFGHIFSNCTILSHLFEEINL